MIGSSFQPPLLCWEALRWFCRPRPSEINMCKFLSWEHNLQPLELCLPSAVTDRKLGKNKTKQKNKTKKVKSVCPWRTGYAEGPELCETVWENAAALGGPGVAAVGGAGGEPVWTWAWNWAICSGLASVFNRVFSCSSWELRSISSLICSFRTSTSSRTAYIRWLFTKSCEWQKHISFCSGCQIKAIIFMTVLFVLILK